MAEGKGIDDNREFKYRGARALVVLHEEHLRRFVETWRTAKASAIDLPKVDDPDYASLDALACGMVVVASDVGVFYDDVPEDCFVKMDWRRGGDVEYVESKLKYAWENREELSRKGREWYMGNCRFTNWKKSFVSIVQNIQDSTDGEQAEPEILCMAE